ncbi:MAG TPA: carboxylesterase family protein [Trebonia sp.]|nr:carboxylesterase family protein [Trebonia sp.]
MVAAQSPASDVEPEVRTAAGRVRGRWASGGSRPDGERVAGGGALAVFKGIPYAQPPVGDLRFLAPRPPRPWGATLEAARFGPPAPQAPFPALLPATPAAGLPGLPRGCAARGAPDGNWLTLNVWTPDPAAAGRLPVLVWLQGGSVLLGEREPGYDASPLARLGVVVVTVNCRLGVEGFAQVADAPANRGLLDSVAALGWVAENIAGFGGDPAAVTVSGGSGGAAIVAALLAMPAARGLFGRAIAQSMPGLFLAPGLAADIAQAVAAEAGIASATRAALAAASPMRLVSAAAAVQARMAAAGPGPGDGPWGPVALAVSPFPPVVDGEVLPRAPWRALLSGAARGVDLLVGHTRDEGRLFTRPGGPAAGLARGQGADPLPALVPGPGGLDAYRTAYPGLDSGRLLELSYSDWHYRMPTLHLAQSHAAAGGRTYLYELAYPAPAAPDALGACHGLDMPLLWDLPPEAPGPPEASARAARPRAARSCAACAPGPCPDGGNEGGTGDGDPGTAGPDAGGTSLLLTGPCPPREFRELGELMRREWVAFATTGDPGWPAYGSQRRLTRVYDWPAAIDPYPEEKSMRLWQRHQFDALGAA